MHEQGHAYQRILRQIFLLVNIFLKKQNLFFLKESILLDLHHLEQFLFSLQEFHDLEEQIGSYGLLQ